MTKFFYVYIVQSDLDRARFYTGSSDDLLKRLRIHNAGRVPHTVKWKPWRLKTYVHSLTALVVWSSNAT